MISELRNLPAPAKLNLFLHVTGRRADGYHLLETVFELIDLADTIDLRLLDDPRVILRDPLPGVAPEADLTVRAARLLAAESGCRLGVEIALRKTIPIGGGLGGGSSDAATVLLGLNRLWSLDWDRDRLARLALALGADVPAFVFGETAYATGIGERLQALPLPPRHYVILAPEVAIATAAIFQAAELTRDTKPLKIRGLSRGRQVFRGRNDLQPVVIGRFPAVAAALETLRQAAQESNVNPALVRMSGSGACVFLPVDNARVASKVAKRLSIPVRGTVFIARSLARHPLRD
jgi:4-diphosphocytidyl-2-C-methyl-D-erythritol kinase